MPPADRPAPVSRADLEGICEALPEVTLGEVRVAPRHLGRAASSERVICPRPRPTGHGPPRMPWARTRWSRAPPWRWAASSSWPTAWGCAVTDG